MSLKKVDEAALCAWVDGLVAKGEVIGVQAKGDRFAFGPLSKAADLRLDYDVALMPPKAHFLPPKEVLSRFQGAAYESVCEAEPFVLMGVHPYDAIAIAQMDAVFAKDNPDAHYFARRNAATIVVCDVQSASENVFAACMNAAVAESGYDVLLTKVEGGYVVEAATDKGEALVADLAGADASEADVAARKAVQDANRKGLKTRDLKVAPGDLADLLAKSEDHPVWEEKAATCFSCGSCNLVCPTCYCFDVQEDANWDLASGERVRKWDGCMLAKFAEVAGAHNFRDSLAARYRHRYYRKGKYLPEMIGQVACVGCGRCVTACVAKIADPVEIYNRLVEASE